MAAPVVRRGSQAFGIDCDTMHLQSGETERNAGGEVARVLDPHRVAVIGQQSGAKIKRGL